MNLTFLFFMIFFMETAHEPVVKVDVRDDGKGTEPADLAKAVEHGGVGHGDADDLAALLGEVCDLGQGGAGVVYRYQGPCLNQIFLNQF